MYWDGPNSEMPNIKKYSESNSLEGQDEWVLNLLSEKRNGTYVEIGGGHPIAGNNTYLLETKYGWGGLSVEIDGEMAMLHKEKRLNPCINANAINFDYWSYFANNHFPKQIDYLQIDIDDVPRNANLLGLIALPLSEYRFSAITIEHGLVTDYRMKELRDAQRLILSSFDYRLIVQGVNEDWWIDTSVIPYGKYGFQFSIRSTGG